MSAKILNYYFISSVGRVLFPQLAEFRFLSWLNFVSLVGIIGIRSYELGIYGGVVERDARPPNTIRNS